jgi:hypothetical protein
MEVKEIHLLGKRFTWSNDQRNPTMTRIGRAFHSVAWEDQHPDPVITPLSSSSSDHCPLKIHAIQTPSVPPMFRFEAHWPLMPGFFCCVQSAWNRPVADHQSAMLTLHIKLSRVSKALTAWSCSLVPQGKLAAEICREVIRQLDLAQESRTLTPDERQLKKGLKNIILGLAAIEKSRAHQKSRLAWLKKGDVNTKYFHIMANTRKK